MRKRRHRTDRRKDERRLVKPREQLRTQAVALKPCVEIIVERLARRLCGARQHSLRRRAGEFFTPRVQRAHLSLHRAREEREPQIRRARTTNRGRLNPREAPPAYRLRPPL